MTILASSVIVSGLQIKAIKQVYQLRHLPLSDETIRKCAAKAEEHQADPCLFGVTEAHCFLGKIRIDIKK
jgi:hypothetical protein